MCICMSKSIYEKINLLLFVQYESEHVMKQPASDAYPIKAQQCLNAQADLSFTRHFACIAILIHVIHYRIWAHSPLKDFIEKIC